MYKDLNDNEILYMVSENNEVNFNILLNKYKPLIYKMIKSYLKTFKKFGYEIDDLMQIGYITLYRASIMYNIYDQSVFYSYFKSALEKNLASVYKVNNTKRKQVLNEALSYDKEIFSNTRFIDIISDKNNKEDVSKNLIIFKNSMPIYLSWIFELYYNGYSKEEISILLDEKLEIIRKDFYKIKEHALTYKYLFFT